MFLVTDYETNVEAIDISEPCMSGPGVAEFEAYSRRELPQMVVARLLADLNTDMVPIAKTLSLLADILSSCQTVVAGNVRSTRGLA